MTERNARHLLGPLALSVTAQHAHQGGAAGPRDTYGQLPAGDFLGRVLTVLALTPQDLGTAGQSRGRLHVSGSVRPAIFSGVCATFTHSPSGAPRTGATTPGHDSALGDSSQE